MIYVYWIGVPSINRRGEPPSDSEHFTLRIGLVTTQADWWATGSMTVAIIWSEWPEAVEAVQRWNEQRSSLRAPDSVYGLWLCATLW